MKRSMGLCLVSAVLAGAVLAQPAAAANSQQEKMASCNAEAKSKSLQGDERKSFMKSCLSAKSGAAGGATNSQQAKMMTCSTDAKSKGLKGDDRKKFMSDCLKGAQ
jgi:hypothetical protein